MALERSDVEKIAHLARLATTEHEAERYVLDLSRILGLVAQMDKVETEGTEPMSHPLHMAQRLRRDIPTETNRREQFQANAPMTEGGLYLVPKVIE